MTRAISKTMARVQQGITQAQMTARNGKEGSKQRLRARKTLNAAYKVQLAAQDHQTEIANFAKNVNAQYDAAYSMLHDMFPSAYLPEMAKTLNKKVEARNSRKLIQWAYAKKKNPKAPKPSIKFHTPVTADGVRAILGLESNVLKGAYLSYRMKCQVHELRDDKYKAHAAYIKSLGLLAEARAEAVAADALNVVLEPTE